MLCFMATGPDGPHIYASDGTAAGTMPVDGLTPGVVSFSPSFADMTASGNSLYFAATDAAHGNELWKLDTVAAPAAPTGLTVTGTTPTQVNLSWNALPSSIAGLRLERSSDPHFPALDESIVLDATSTAYSDAAANSAATVYYYRLRALGTAGTSAVSSTVFAGPAPAAVSGALFKDIDGNGQRDVLDTSLAGWTVFDDLNGDGQLESGELSTTSGPDGHYVLQLPAGPYSIVELPHDATWTATTGPFAGTLAAGQSITGDFGNIQRSMLGGKLHDPNGVPLAPWTVYLDLAQDYKLDPGDPTTVTAADGSFHFTVTAGSYHVLFVAQPGWSSGIGTFVTLVAGQTATTDLTAMPLPGNITGTVFTDSNDNGVFDAGEGPPFGSVTVYLDRNGNGVFDPPADLSVTTSGSGAYSFNGVPVGTYPLRVVVPSGQRVTAPAGGFAMVSMLSNQTITVNFGLGAVLPTTITGTSGATGDQIELRAEPGGSRVDYWVNPASPFTGAPTGSYNLSTGALLIDGAGGAPDILTLDTSYGPVFPAGPGNILESIGGSLSINVLGTSANDSLRLTAGSLQIAGASAAVYNTSSITFNDGGGNDSVLVSGSIPLTLNTGNGVDALTIAAGASATVNFGSSSPDLTVNNSGNVVINYGTGSPTVKFATVGTVPVIPPPLPKAVITGRVYDDLNANAFRNAVDKGLGGRTVYIDKNRNGKLDPGETHTTTSRDGSYQFTGLAAGKYLVRAIIPTDWRATEAAAGYDMTVTAGQNRADKDFGQTTLGLVSGTVFRDTNGNGRQDSSETALAGSIVYLDTNNDGKLDAGDFSMKTDSSGRYSFAVPAGRYIIRVVPRSGLHLQINSFARSVSSGQIAAAANFAVR
jgi:hypothetical protein